MMNKYSNGVEADAAAAGSVLVRVGVLGASGYAGVELLNRLARHPGVELVAAMGSGRSEPVPVADLAPAWHGRTELLCGASAPEAMRAAGAECVFLCTPAEISSDWVAALGDGAGPKIVDLSGALRFRDDVVYGWPEKNRDAIRPARLVANPGCYATAAITALWPLTTGGLIELDDIVCDAKSGVSGAGKGLRADLHFAELEGNSKAYNVFVHRHAPEITRHAEFESGAATFSFTPHLLPTSRGILATTYARLKPGVAAEQIAAAYERAYRTAPFVRVRGSRLPEIKDVVHTNFCDVGWVVRGSRLVVITCLDNLVKGAAGQALQNFNLMTGWPEETALL